MTAVIAVTLALSVMVILVYLTSIGPQKVPQQIVRLILTGVLCVFLYRGVNWARWVAGILFVLAGIVGIASGTALLYIGAGAFVLLAMGAVYVGSAVILLFVPSVRTYFGSSKHEQDEESASETTRKDVGSSATNT